MFWKNKAEKILSPKEQYDNELEERYKYAVKNNLFSIDISKSNDDYDMHYKISIPSCDISYENSVRVYLKYTNWYTAIWNNVYIKTDRYWTGWRTDKYYELQYGLYKKLIKHLSEYILPIIEKDRRDKQLQEDTEYLKKLSELKKLKPLDDDLKQKFKDAQKIIDYWYEIKDIEKKIQSIRNK